MRTAICSLTRCFTSKRVIPFAAALFAMAVLAAPASAQNCLQDQYKAAGNTQTLSCTANDVRVAKVIDVRKLNGDPLTTCNAGSTFNFIADFLVTTTSNSSRSNIGLYFGVEGASQATALSGTCSDNIIPPAHTCAGSSVSCGSSHYDELDPSPDNCGDSSSTDPTVCLDSSNNIVGCPAPAGGSTFPSTQIVTVEIDNFTCAAPAGTTQLVLPNCTSWQVPGKTIQCVAAGPDYLYPLDTNEKPEAIPGSPSKCNCATIPLPITVQSPSVTVGKACTTANTPGTTNTSCTLSPEGGDVTYTVSITNESNFGDVIVDQICDSAYGNVFTAGGFGGPACTAGSIGTINSTTCTALDIAAGDTGTCTFTVTQAEAVTVKDIVNVSGHGASAGTFGPSASTQVTVTSGEATTAGTITKSLAGTTAGCVTVRYGVDVKNTSATGTDETLTLSALSDTAYGDITKWTGTGNSSVLGTTCGVAKASSGLGTLSGSSGAGALPVTLAVNGGDYTCQFDAQFCGGLGTITTVAGKCDIGTGKCSAGKPATTGCSSDSQCDVTCNGIEHSNTVSATLTGDEGATDVVTLTPGTLTVDQCFLPASAK